MRNSGLNLLTPYGQESNVNGKGVVHLSIKHSFKGLIMKIVHSWVVFEFIWRCLQSNCMSYPNLIQNRIINFALM